MVPHVLVIEDNEPHRRLCEDLLRASGYLVDSADCAAEGLRKAMMSQPDMILCDLRLPIKHGERDYPYLGAVLCKTLREEADCRSTIVLMSAYFQNTREERAIQKENGADAVLDKSVMWREIQARLKAIENGEPATVH